MRVSQIRQHGVRVDNTRLVVPFFIVLSLLFRKVTKVEMCWLLDINDVLRLFTHIARLLPSKSVILFLLLVSFLSSFTKLLKRFIIQHFIREAALRKIMMGSKLILVTWDEFCQEPVRDTWIEKIGKGCGT